MTQENAYTPAYREDGIPCLICRQPLSVQLAYGRKSKKPSVMLKCSVDGRHFRGFISDKEYVKGVLERLEGKS